MSDAWAKAERSKAKDARQIPVQEKVPKRKPGKKDKPFAVYFKYTQKRSEGASFLWFSDWHLFGRYKTKEIAEKVIKDDKRKWPDYYVYEVR